jgi:alkylation response protein AidB-like acyl-CoA dehydrogenase
VTETLDAYRARAREWLAVNLDPRTEENPGLAAGDEDYTDEYLRAQRGIQRRLHEAGYAGITWPEEYGGQGLPKEYEDAFLEEAAGYCTPDFGLTALTTFGVCVPTILATASDDFKRRHVPRVLRGEELWAQFFSEPSAGSDLAAIKTTARREGDEWVINGAKTWSSFAHRCDIGLCLARTDPEAPRHRGLTWFAVPTDAPGLTLRQFRQIDGEFAFCEEFFDDVRVPDAERVGEIDDGWAVTHRMLLFERDSDGIAKQTDLSPGPLAPDLVELARALGRDFEPEVAQAIATAHVNDYVQRQLFVRIDDCVDGDPIGTAAFGKLFRGTFDPIRAKIGLELAGPSALGWDDESAPGRAAATAYLNGRVFSIAGGTNEMQRNAIAERVHGLPREPRGD